MKFWFQKKDSKSAVSASIVPDNPNAKYTLEDLKAAYSFAFAEGIIFGMNTSYHSKEFADWLKERNENRLV